MLVTNTHDQEIQVQPLMCDKLGITVDIPDQYRSTIVGSLKNDGAYTAKRSRYRYTLKIPLNNVCLPYLDADKTGETHLIIQAEPKNESHNFLRVEYNPSKIDNVMLPHAMSCCYPITFEYIMDNARVSRIDLTCDIVNASIDSFLFYSKKKLWNEIHTKSGKTIYLGQKTGLSRFCIYDKRAEVKAKNQLKQPLLKDVIPPPDVTRIEVVLAFKKKTSLQDILNIANPFTDLILYKYPDDYTDDTVFYLLLRLARHEGISTVIKVLPKHLRSKYRGMMEQHQVGWWNPAELWAQIPSVINDIINPASASNDAV